MKSEARQSNRRWPKEIARILWRKLECPTCTSIEFHEAPHRAIDGIFELLRFIPLQLQQLLALLLLVWEIAALTGIDGPGLHGLCPCHPRAVFLSLIC